MDLFWKEQSLEEQIQKGLIQKDTCLEKEDSLRVDGSDDSELMVVKDGRSGRGHLPGPETYSKITRTVCP
jgi:hypothetical protein